MLLEYIYKINTKLIKISRHVFFNLLPDIFLVATKVLTNAHLQPHTPTIIFPIIMRQVLGQSVDDAAADDDERFVLSFNEFS